MKQMPVMKISDLRPDEQLERTKAKVLKKLNEGLHKSIETELKQFKEAADMIEKLSTSGYIFHHFSNIRVTSMQLMCAYQMYYDIFLNQESPEYRKPESEIFRKTVLQTIAEEEYADLTETLNELNERGV